MWRLGFFFHEMAFGLLSIFLPLYVIAMGGTLVDIGMMASVALFLAIPASFLWGYLCDKMRRYKVYILLSFIMSTVLLYTFTLTTDIPLIITIYALMSVFHVAHEAPKNVLVAELYSRQEWEKSYALYEGFTEIGWLIGLLSGFFMSNYGFNSTTTLLVCCILNLVAFFLSVILVADPLFIFERSLVNIEKAVGFTFRGVSLASGVLGSRLTNERLKTDNVRAFCAGLVLFSLASSILFTPMPIFISRIMQAASLPSSFVFAIYVLNSSGGIAGYLLAARRSDRSHEKTSIGKIVVARTLLAFLLVAALQTSGYMVIATTTILVLMGFAYALFLTYTLSLSMELIPSGKAGLFNVLIGIGGAGGSFIGPLVAQVFDFAYVFAGAGAVFLLAYVSFKVLM